MNDFKRGGAAGVGGVKQGEWRMNTQGFQTLADKTPGMKDIVGILTHEGTITNLPGDIVLAIRDNRVKTFLDRNWMELMASFDFGPQWERLASGPTLFSVDWKAKAVTPGVISWSAEKVEVGVGE